MRKIDDALKQAILGMKPADKDKLLLRLVGKDALLVKKLVYELLEDGNTSDSRMRELEAEIDRRLKAASGAGQTPGYLLMDFRSLNPLITEHVKVTKDKFGEVYLTLKMLRTGLEINQVHLQKFPIKRYDTLAPYVVRRVQQVLEKAGKLHEDYHIEFRRDLNALLSLVYEGYPAIRGYAEEAGLPRQWGL
jgi:hypothetical protein